MGGIGLTHFKFIIRANEIIHFCDRCRVDTENIRVPCYDVLMMRNGYKTTVIGSFCPDCLERFVKEIASAYNVSVDANTVQFEKGAGVGNVPRGTDYSLISDSDFKELCGFFRRSNTIGTTERMFANYRAYTLKQFVEELLNRYSKLESDRDNWRKQALAEDERANAALKGRVERNFDRFDNFDDMVKAWSDTYTTHRIPFKKWVFEKSGARRDTF